MECIYYPSLEESSGLIQIKGPEAKHLRALRLSTGSKILVSNGKGLCSVCEIIAATKSEFSITPVEYLGEYGEPAEEIGLAIGILNQRERLEFAIEKAIELGVTDIYPLLTDFAQKKKINKDRLLAKSVAAMKQCRRSRLPKIHDLMNVSEFIISAGEYESRLVADISGDNPGALIKPVPTVLLVGPEGGFSDGELINIQDAGFQSCRLSGRRLRTETAAITGISLISSAIDL